MPATRTAVTYRFEPETHRKIAEIADAQQGLADVRVVTWAIDELHRSVCREPAPAPTRRPPRKNPNRKTQT